MTTLMASLLPVHAAITIEWLADAASTAAERALGAPFAFVYWEDQDGRLQRQLPASDLRRRQLQRALDAFGESLIRPKLDPKAAPTIAEALDSRTPITTSPEELFRGLPGVDAAAAAQKTLGVEAASLVPLEAAGERIGALLLLLSRPVESDHLRLLGEHISCAAVNLRNALSNASQQPQIDVARPVFDERKLETELQRELARAARYKRELSVVVVEATNIGLLRDVYGKFLAERRYALLGEALAECARDTDIVGSYKERGYTVILTEAQVGGVAGAARRLLAAAQASPAEGETVPGLELHLVAGWASFPGDGQASDTLFEMVELRMYDAESQKLVA